MAETSKLPLLLAAKPGEMDTTSDVQPSCENFLEESHVLYNELYILPHITIFKPASKVALHMSSRWKLRKSGALPIYYPTLFGK
jgi:hypothetical protein